METCMADVEVRELTVYESHQMFDALARKSLGIGRIEFLARLDQGELNLDVDEDQALVKLRMLAPFAR
jgi:hypothetical protein